MNQDEYQAEQSIQAIAGFGITSLTDRGQGFGQRVVKLNIDNS